MSRRLPMTTLLIVFCISVGFGLFLFKVLNAGFPLFPDERIKSWHIETKINVLNAGENLKISLALPTHYPNFTLLE